METQLESELVDPNHTAILVIDPQYDLCSEYLPNGEKTPLAKMSDAAGIIPPSYDFNLYPGVITKLKPLLNVARQAGVLVIYTKASRLPKGSSPWGKRSLSKMYRIDTTKISVPEFVIEGTPGYEFVEEIKPHPGDVVIKKVRNSAFVGTPIELLLKNRGIKTLILTGCQTDGCVESTLRDAGYSYDYLCIVVEDCVGSFNVEMHHAMMQVMKRRFDVIRSEKLIQLWQSLL